MGRVGGRQRVQVEEGSEESSGLFVQALGRGLSILALFDVEQPEWSLDEVSRKTGISKTTAYRMLRTLEYKGFLSFDGETERYHIGPAAIPVSYLAISCVAYTRQLHAHLEQLAEETGETIELAVEGRGGAVVVDHVATSHPFKANLPLGRVLRNLANSAMKILVAYQPSAARQRIIAKPQAKLTPNTVTDPRLISEELDRVVVEGLAFDIEEQNIGVSAVSAPVFGPDGELKAAVTIVTPAERFTGANRAKLSKAVVASAVELTHFFGRVTSQE
jgi:DNA-binding IclR family transcriptional regulator